jgi:hypothetical protein
MNNSNAAQCYAFCSLFEAEVLLELMMQRWDHPFADNESYRSGLLESATELLSTSAEESCSQIFIEDLAPEDMNFVAAVWYCEWCGAQDDREQYELRQEWLKEVRRVFPSCFCSSKLL